jgi:hypothetical protein
MTFRGRKRSSLRKAIEKTADPEIKVLHQDLTVRQERVAELELELFDYRATLARFEQRLEKRVRPLQRKLEDLQSALRQARHNAERRAQWGDNLDSDRIPDVVSQFQRAWTPRDGSKIPPKQDRAPDIDPEELKTLFRELAKRFHPDLTMDQAEKRWREKIMAKVNEAYAAGDLAALAKLAEQPDRPPEAVEKTREETMRELSAEILRLDRLIINLERQVSELSRSETLQLQLEVTMAQHEGRDLLREMASSLESDIARAEAELASLR